MPAAVLVHILQRIVYPEKEQTLQEIVCGRATRSAACSLATRIWAS